MNYSSLKRRVVHAYWEGGNSNSYLVHVIIKAYKRKGLISEITYMLDSSQVNLFFISSSTKQQEDNIIYFHLDLKITVMSMLESVLSKIQNISCVIDILITHHY